MHLSEKETMINPEENGKEYAMLMHIAPLLALTPEIKQELYPILLFLGMFACRASRALCWMKFSARNGRTSKRTSEKTQTSSIHKRKNKIPRNPHRK